MGATGFALDGRSSVALSARIFSVLLLLPAIGETADFRVVTNVYAENVQRPVSSNTTIFRDGRAFDFVEGRSEVTVYDPQLRRFLLVDTARKLKTEISTNQLFVYGSWIVESIERQNDALLAFAAEPRFRISTGPRGELRFTSAEMEYQVSGHTAPQPEIAAAYRDFSDWYARLNSLLQPGALPPFPRLAVNERVAREGWIPHEVRLRLASHARFGDKEMTLRAEHQTDYRLEKSDVRRTDSVLQQIQAFRAVTIDEFRRAANTQR